MTRQSSGEPCTAERRRPRAVRARRPVTRAVLPERTGTLDDPLLSRGLENLWDATVAESQALARRLGLLAAWWVPPGDEVTRGDLDRDASTADLQVACAMRTTRPAAAAMIADAHLALTHLPRLYSLLREGAMPAAWFQRVLRSARALGEEGCWALDAEIGTWDLGIGEDRFRRELARLVLWLRTEHEPARSPEQLRAVSTFANDDGTACLSVTGPSAEILSLGMRLDASAREVQVAQRRALETGRPAPFDDGTVASTGVPMTLAAIRYAVMTRTLLQTGGVEVPQGRFRLNITVPLMTLLGRSDAPGTIEGVAPIPADVARDLAGQCETWYRVMTDPTSGAFAPLPADRYRPTSAMLEHLRLRSQTCAAPGCRRPVSRAAEADHIREYRHADPASGGRTEMENLHLLCWAHHQQKTAGHLDPVRLPGVIRILPTEEDGTGSPGSTEDPGNAETVAGPRDGSASSRAERPAPGRAVRERPVSEHPVSARSAPERAVLELPSPGGGAPALPWLVDARDLPRPLVPPEPPEPDAPLVVTEADEAEEWFPPGTPVPCGRSTSPEGRIPPASSPPPGAPAAPARSLSPGCATILGRPFPDGVGSAICPGRDPLRPEVGDVLADHAAVPAPGAVIMPGATRWQLGSGASVLVPDDVDLMTPLTVREFHLREAARARHDRDHAPREREHERLQPRRRMAPPF